MSIAENVREKKEASRVPALKQAAIVIPTYNASKYWKRMQNALQEQGVSQAQVLIIDSSSTDNTRDLVKRAGYQLKTIRKGSFRHGATRQFAAESLHWADVLVYLTQDALPCGKDSLKNLLRGFAHPGVGACYGRQLPREQANPIERHARLFNYPDESSVRTFESRRQLGLKAAFFSNSFAAYRRTALEEVGGFPRNTIVSEEVTVAARMLMAGWKVSYIADATAIHSHPLTVRGEFSRYFDIGVHHGRESWLLDEFGGAGGEGRRFVVSEAKYLLEQQWTLLPLAMLRNVSKYCSYQLGRHEHLLPQELKEALSAQPDYWLDERTPEHLAQTQHSIVAPSS